MRRSLAFLALAALAGNSWAQTSPPTWGAPPQVTVGADLKELIFDWEPVPGAVTYRLLRKTTSNPREYYAPYDETRLRQPHVSIPVSVHLTTWDTTRYIVLACNLAGCSRSAEIYPRDLMLDTIGFFKASNSNSKDLFGSQIAMSEDGGTLAVAAPAEASDATGANGDQANNNLARSGAIYVFRRSGNVWSQEGYLKATDSQYQLLLGSSTVPRQRNLALSADGSTLAVGAPRHSLPGISNAGAVYLFKRGADNAWAPHAQFTAPTPSINDQFGYTLDLSSDGLTLKVSSQFDASGDRSGFVGAVHLWTHDGASWNYSNLDSHRLTGDYCQTSRMSTDGQTIVLNCYADASGGGRLRTLKRTSANTWAVANSVPFDSYGGNMAINHAATWLAINRGGGIGMYRWENGAWVLDVTILPWSITNGRWAEAMEFSRNGEYFAIGDPSATASGRGVSDNAYCCSTQDGAVLLYKFRPEGIPMWYSIKQIKATNPEAGDLFGSSIAFGRLGQDLAIGAPREDAAATGVDGDQTNNIRVDSGAIYLY